MRDASAPSQGRFEAPASAEAAPPNPSFSGSRASSMAGGGGGGCAAAR